MSFELDLGGRTALVTGGGQGVGQAICSALSTAGARVLVNDYVPERADRVAEEINAAGGTAEPCPFDVSDFAAVTSALGTKSGVDILVNNAGNAGPGGWANSVAGKPDPKLTLVNFVDTEPPDWDRYFAVNLYGVMNCSRAALPHMISAGEGRIITIVSDAGRVGEPRMAAYAAAKAGAAGFTRALAREVGREGITVNNVALGTMENQGVDEAAQASPEMAERRRRQLKRYIVPRTGRPEDVSALVTFLASPHASWITGQTYPVNGGYSVNQ